MTIFNLQQNLIYLSNLAHSSTSLALVKLIVG